MFKYTKLVSKLAYNEYIFKTKLLLKTIQVEDTYHELVLFPKYLHGLYVLKLTAPRSKRFSWSLLSDGLEPEKKVKCDKFLSPNITMDT